MKSSILLILFFCMISFYAVAQTDSAVLQEYQGSFKFPDGSATERVDITLDSGVLNATSSIGNASFKFSKKDTFSIPSYSGIAYFIRGSNGKIKGIHIEAGDVILDGEKIVALQEAMIRPRKNTLPPTGNSYLN